MESKKSYNSIGKYDKHNNLITYLEYVDDSDDVKCYYNVKGNILERILLDEYYEEPLTQIMSSIVQYENNIMLFNLRTNGETYMCPILSGENFTSIQSPNITNSVFSYMDKGCNEAVIENFNIKSDLISDYLNKL